MLLQRNVVQFFEIITATKGGALYSDTKTPYVLYFFLILELFFKIILLILQETTCMEDYYIIVGCPSLVLQQLIGTLKIQ